MLLEKAAWRAGNTGALLDDLASVAAPARSRRGSLAWLQRVLSDDATRESGALAVRVGEHCGSVEVDVMGPAARLRLSFDRAELDTGHVRQVVRSAVIRYRSALLARPGAAEKELTPC